MTTNLQNRRFLKMHGLGNDFIIFDAREEDISLTPEAVRVLSDRHTGVGCDQLIIMRPALSADIFMEIRNADGGRVGACGNATRCVGLLMLEETGRDCATIQTDAGILTATRHEAGVLVNMGLARTEWQEIPLAQASDTLAANLTVGPLSAPVCVNMGNPHAIFFVENAETIDLEHWGPEIEQHALFPEHVNVSVASVRDGHIRQRVWERGAGITMACGSGACAAMVAASRRGLVGRSATVTLDGGPLEITWRADGTVDMAGPATLVYEAVLPA